MFGWFRKRQLSSREANKPPVAPGRTNKLAYYRSHPPRCIAGFKAQPVELPGVAFDGHGEEFNPVFTLLCTCGHGKHFVLGHYWRNPDWHNALLFVGPFAIRCGACGKVTELFDSAIHGWDGELGHSASYRGEGERAEFSCDRCGLQQVQVFARFEYPGDLLGPGNEEFRGREQDLFSWFSLLGKCAGCGRLLEVSDCECA